LLKIEVSPNGCRIEDLRQVSEILKNGGVGILPTDTVYGLFALAESEAGVRRVFEIKERPFEKPLPVQISEVCHAQRLAVADCPGAGALIGAFWPGPLTLVLDRRSGGPELPFQSSDKLGLRIPDSPVCLALIDLAGYMVAPSANLSGDRPPVSFEDISPEILGMVDFAVDGGACQLGIESTVVDLTGGLKILREGALAARDVMRVVSCAGEETG